MKLLLSFPLLLVTASLCAASGKASAGYVQILAPLVEAHTNETGMGQSGKKIPELSAEDVTAITALVRTKTDEPILNITPQSKTKVSVMTGVNKIPLAGGGDWFTIKRVGKKWKIIEHGRWAS